MKPISRRQFLEFMGGSALTLSSLGTLTSCVSHPIRRPPGAELPFVPLPSNRIDDLTLAKGFKYDVVLSWGDELNEAGERFGFNNDYTAFLPLDPADYFEGLLWVNHESHDPIYNGGWQPGQKRTREQVDRERKVVGGSIVHIRMDDGRWKPVPNSQYNRRLDAYTPIPLIAERPIMGKTTAIGTLANCAGGVTPWGSILTCEENYQNFVGDVAFENGKRRLFNGDEYLSWMGLWDVPPEHYGWVVEVDLKTGKAKKLTALGRFSHESATCIQAADGRTVVYSGDDCDQEHLYKFISKKPGSLEQGDLYVADLESGRWLPLDRKKDPRLQKNFEDHTELLIRTREAAKIVGATPLNRPEDIEIDPKTRAVYMTLTLSKVKKDRFGSILKLEEKNADPLSLEFESSRFLAGGPETDFANPDNLAFDPQGNLWMCSDMADSSMYRKKFAGFNNNSLYYIPMSGPSAGQVFRVASAPRGAELTGPSFSPDGHTLFLSVQHPGEKAFYYKHLESHWPLGGKEIPKPSVVAISGPALDHLTNISPSI